MNIRRGAVTTAVVAAVGTVAFFGYGVIDPEQDTLNKLAADVGYSNIVTVPTDDWYVSRVTAVANNDGEGECHVFIERQKKAEDPDVFTVYKIKDGERVVLWEFQSLKGSLEEVSRVC
jgi:hypothetical protein